MLGYGHQRKFCLTISAWREMAITRSELRWPACNPADCTVGVKLRLGSVSGGLPARGQSAERCPSTSVQGGWGAKIHGHA